MPLYEFKNSSNDWTNQRLAQRVYSAPTVVNLEITEGCNFKCLHCYNPWRDVSAGKNQLTIDQFDFLLEEFKRCGVFHVILSGGEPLANYKILKYAIVKLLENNISISCNSNLSLMSLEKARELKSLGLDHVLGSWYSTESEVTEQITQVSGAQDSVIQGIRNCIEVGIRVSVNTIVTSHTKDTVLQAGEFLAKMGVYQFIAHRVIPPAYERNAEQPNPANNITKEDALGTLDDLLYLKDKYNINVSTLISYPLCMIGDLDKYSDFVGRGCPSQSGHRFSINASGDTHTCVMEDASYGSIFEDGLEKVYARGGFWRDNSVFYEGCKGCEYIDVCQTGCRMSAFSSTGYIDGKDPLFVGPLGIYNHIKAIKNRDILDYCKDSSNTLTIPTSLRFRKETNFGLVNIRWGNTIELDSDLFDIIFEVHSSSLETLSVKQLLDSGASSEFIASLVSKEVLTIPSYTLDSSHRGVSTDPSKLPKVCFQV